MNAHRLCFLMIIFFFCTAPIPAQQWVRLGSPIGSADIRAFCNAGDTLYAGGQSLLRSTDGGETWSTANSGIASNSIVLGLESLSGRVFAATTTGVYRSTNHGQNWSPGQQRFGD